MLLDSAPPPLLCLSGYLHIPILIKIKFAKMTFTHACTVWLGNVNTISEDLEDLAQPLDLIEIWKVKTHLLDYQFKFKSMIKTSF